MVIPELKHGPRAAGPRATARSAASSIDAVVRRVRPRGACSSTSGRSTATTRARAGCCWRTTNARSRGCEDAVEEWRDDLGEDARFLPRDELARGDRHVRVPRGSARRTHGRAAAGEVPRRPGAPRPRRGRGAPRPYAGASRSSGARAAGTASRTTRGVVDAGEVFLATNAYADELVPELRRRVLPIGSFIIATEPLERRSRAIVHPPGPHGLRREELPLLLAALTRRSHGVRRADEPRAAPRSRPRATPCTGRWCGSTRSSRACRSSLRVGRQRRDHLRPAARTAGACRSPAAASRVRDRVQRHGRRARDVVRARVRPRGCRPRSRRPRSPSSRSRRCRCTRRGDRYLPAVGWWFRGKGPRVVGR